MGSTGMALDALDAEVAEKLLTKVVMVLHVAVIAIGLVAIGIRVGKPAKSLS